MSALSQQDLFDWLQAHDIQFSNTATIVQLKRLRRLPLDNGAGGPNM